MEQYKITLKRQLANGWTIFLYLSLCIGFIYYDFQNNPDEKKLIRSVIFFFIFLIALLIPQLIIHLNYYLINKDDELSYEENLKKFQFIHKGEVVTFYLDDIKSAVLSKSWPLHNKSIYLLTWDMYNHAIINLKNNTKIVITSLMIGGEIKLPIEENRITLKRNLFRLAKGPSLQRDS